MSDEKTLASHAFVIRGSTEASDALIEHIESLDEAELVYQKHSYDNLYVTEGEQE
jgi:hypothetical protein